MSQPKVSITINTWAPESKKYLDLCVESVQRLNYPKDLIDVTVVGRKSYQPEYKGVKTVAPDSDDFTNEFGQNFVIRHTDPESKYLFMLNDDCVCTPDSLRHLIDVAGDQDLMVMPISPCDNYWKYQLMFPIKYNGNVVMLSDRFYRYEQLESYRESLLHAESIYPPGVLMTEMLCTFALLLPRKTYERIGPFDEEFNCGQSDFDYCLRAQQMGIPRAIALHSLVWHFGGATSSNTMTAARKVSNARHFRKKWGVWPEGFDLLSIPDPTERELREAGFIGE